jgi:hypothetical protein
MWQSGVVAWVPASVLFDGALARVKAFRGATPSSIVQGAFAEDR